MASYYGDLARPMAQELIMDEASEWSSQDIDRLEAACRQILPGGEAAILPQVDSDEIERVYARGYASLQDGQYESALVDFTYLVINRAWDQRFQMALGVALQRVGEYEYALRFFGYALYLDACDPRPSYRVAECLIALDEIHLAREALQTAIRQSASDPAFQAVADRAEALLNRL